MRKINLEELKKVQLDILDKVVFFCESNDINYFLDCGTLLGAIRHKGYIPWDDDIDIGMLRPDYDRFIKLFNQDNDRYKCVSMYNDPYFGFAFAKVMDTDTELYEPCKDKGIKMSINIDVFVYDSAPEDSKQLEEMYNNRDKYLVWYRRRVWPYMKRTNKVKIVLGLILYELLSIIPVSYFINKVNNNQQKYNDFDTQYVGNFSSDTRFIAHKSIFKDFIEIEFEDRKYKIPIGYDEWLKSFYGDYMQLPPVEKRVSKHEFEAYINDANSN